MCIAHLNLLSPAFIFKIVHSKQRYATSNTSFGIGWFSMSAGKKVSLETLKHIYLEIIVVPLTSKSN
jgi:hypothetical protein